MKRFRQYGWDNNRNTKNNGINSRLDELQAAVLRVRLKSLDKENKLRNFQSNLYKKKLSNS